VENEPQDIIRVPEGSARHILTAEQAVNNAQANAKAIFDIITTALQVPYGWSILQDEKGLYFAKVTLEEEPNKNAE
jgi:hypothetical protein